MDAGQGAASGAGAAVTDEDLDLIETDRLMDALGRRFPRAFLLATANTEKRGLLQFWRPELDGVDRAGMLKAALWCEQILWVNGYNVDPDGQLTAFRLRHSIRVNPPTPIGLPSCSIIIRWVSHSLLCCCFKYSTYHLF